MEITTTNLADFGSRERFMLIQLLQAWQNQGLPDDFYNDEVVPMMNRQSGNVFLTNSEYQVAMIDDNDKLSMWHTCHECGHEGFQEDCQLSEDGCNECNEITDEEEE